MASVTFEITRIRCYGVSDAGQNDEVFFYVQADAGNWIRYPAATPGTISMTEVPDDGQSHTNQNLGTDDDPVYCDVTPGSNGWPAMKMDCNTCVYITGMDQDVSFDVNASDYLGSVCLMLKNTGGAPTMRNGTSSSYQLDYTQSPASSGEAS